MDEDKLPLVNTLLRRYATSGGTVQSRELKSCSLDLDKKCMVLDFDIASKGGGQTHINIQCSIEDMVNVLNQYIKERPDEVGFDTRLIPPKSHKVRWNPFTGKEELIENKVMK